MNYELVFEGLSDYWSAHYDDAESHWVYTERLFIDDGLFMGFKSEDFEGLGTVEFMELHNSRNGQQLFYITRIDRPIDGFLEFGGPYYYCGNQMMDGEILKNDRYRILLLTGVDIEG